MEKEEENEILGGAFTERALNRIPEKLTEELVGVQELPLGVKIHGTDVGHQSTFRFRVRENSAPTIFCSAPKQSTTKGHPI